MRQMTFYIYDRSTGRIVITRGSMSVLLDKLRILGNAPARQALMNMEGI
jgi:hypothetical protein